MTAPETLHALANLAAWLVLLATLFFTFGG